jgi:hypothetical protein
VSGLTQKSDPTLRIIANAFTESLGVYTNNPSHKGGVFKGEKCVWVSVSGSANALDLSTDFRVMDTKNDKKQTSSPRNGAPILTTSKTPQAENSFPGESIRVHWRLNEKPLD